jgi:hypothetical protein
LPSQGAVAAPGKDAETHPGKGADKETPPTALHTAARPGEGTGADPADGAEAQRGEVAPAQLGEGAATDPTEDTKAHPAQTPAADPVALAVLEETAEYVGAGLSDLVNLFQPERILIGGWAGLKLGPRLLPALRRYADAYSLRHPAERVSIDLGELGPDAVTVGAASLTLADFFARGGRPAARVRDREGAKGAKG